MIYYPLKELEQYLKSQQNLKLSFAHEKVRLKHDVTCSWKNVIIPNKATLKTRSMDMLLQKTAEQVFFIEQSK